MNIYVWQSLTVDVFEVTNTGGVAWKVRVGDTSNRVDAYWEKTGVGDTVFNTGLFGVGTHYAFLLVSDAVQATTQWYEQAVVYTPPTPTPPPPPPPTPPSPIDSGDGERVGYCTLRAYQSFGQTWYDVVHDDGSRIAGGETYEDAKHKASSYEECQRAPAVAPPSTAAPGPAAIADAVAGKLQPGMDGLKADTESLLTTASTTVSTGTLNFRILDSIKTFLLPALQEKANNIYSRLESVPAQISEIRNTLVGKIDSVAAWQSGFTWPSWDAVVVQPISSRIDAKVSAMFGIDPALPFWDALAAKIDIRISQKFGVDPALPFFDALWAKIERKVDVWFSGKLGIDPALPFWEEIEKKISSMFVRVVNKILDEMITPPPGVI